MLCVYFESLDRVFNQRYFFLKGPTILTISSVLLVEEEEHGNDAKQYRWDSLARLRCYCECADKTFTLGRQILCRSPDVAVSGTLR